MHTTIAPIVQAAVHHFQKPSPCKPLSVALLCTAAGLVSPYGVLASEPSPALAKAAVNKAAVVQSLVPGTVERADAVRLVAGKSQVLRLGEPATRLSVGNPDVADVMLIHPREVYLLGKKPGTTNLLVWGPGGGTTLRDVTVSADVQSLQSTLRDLVPSSDAVRVDALADTLVLSGRVSDALKVHRIVELSEAFNSGRKVVNMLRVEGSQQVMLEVKVAEVSKTLLDQLGVEFNMTRTLGSTTVSVLSQLMSSGASSISTSRPNGLTQITLTAEMKKGLVKVLAEPTITAVNGQEGSFLAGGKIFIPVPQSSQTGGTTITLEEKEFGVGLRFLPTVLEEGLINLRVTPEVSELSQVGTAIVGPNGQNSLLPSITTRRASTTVQLRDGESFAIGGLIKSNVTEAIKAMPLLGELPVLGALFRSTAFQTEQSELLFIVTPRLARPLQAAPALPTDNFKPPSRSEFLFEGRLEGQPAARP